MTGIEEDDSQYYYNDLEGTTSSGIPREVLQRVLDRDEGMCMNCGNSDPEELHPHHVVFRSQQGTHDEDNIVTVCWKCHDLLHRRRLFVKRINGHWYFRRSKRY